MCEADVSSADQVAGESFDLEIAMDSESRVS